MLTVLTIDQKHFTKAIIQLGLNTLHHKLNFLKKFPILQPLSNKQLFKLNDQL